MQILLDTANVEHVEHFLDYYPVSGVTTNPTILAKEKKPFMPLLQEIRKCIGEERALHVQIIAQKAEDIMEEATYLQDAFAGNVYVKVPVTEEGLKAIRLLAETGIKTTATAVFTAQQAHLAALAGADYVAPYVNRIDNLTGHGVHVVSDIVHIFAAYHLKTKVLGASFKNVEQVHQCCLSGAHAVTVDPIILKQVVMHPSVDVSVEQFTADWKEAYGTARLR